MAKLRSASAYRKLKRPFTRTSKFRKKSFIKGAPVSRVTMHDQGNVSGTFKYRVDLVARKDINLRHNAIEAMRVAASKILSETLGKQGFHLKIRAVPHNVIRENPLATGAGADRISTGMKLSFGRPVSRSAQIRKGKPMISVFVNEPGINAAKLSLKKAAYKTPIGCKIVTEEA